MPRHHNIIRFRRGLAVIKDDFSTVCSWVQFPNREEWKYDLFLGSLMFYVLCRWNYIYQFWLSLDLLRAIASYIFKIIISFLILAKNPVPVRCPVAGKFNFTQRGEHPFKTRYEIQLTDFYTLIEISIVFLTFYLKFFCKQYSWWCNTESPARYSV